MDRKGFTQSCSFHNFLTIYNRLLDFETKYHVVIPYYALSGGSPLLNPNCLQMVRYLRDNRKYVALLDVPEMVTASSIQLMREGGVRNYQVSLDGMKETHDRIRGAGSYDKTLNAVKSLQGSGILPSIMFTLSKSNKDELLPLCRFLLACNALEHFHFSFDFVVPFGHADNLKVDYLSAPEADSVLQMYYDFTVKNSTPYKQFRLKPSKYRVPDFWQSGAKTTAKYCYPVISGCNIGWDSVCILPNGDVLPCRRLPIVLGNLLEESFEDIFLGSDLLRKFRRYSQYQKHCGICEYGKLCRGCPAISYAMTGDCFEKFPLCENDFKNAHAFDADIPPMNCSNEAEFSYIKGSLKNAVSLRPEDVFMRYPNIKKLMREQKSIHTQADNIEWVKKVKSENDLDALHCLQYFSKANLNL